MTSLKFDAIRCATTLCHFGQTRSSYVAIPLILGGSTATSSATGDYVAVPECFGQNEERLVKMRDGLGKSLVCSQKLI